MRRREKKKHTRDRSSGMCTPILALPRCSLRADVPASRRVCQRAPGCGVCTWCLPPRLCSLVRFCRCLSRCTCSSRCCWRVPLGTRGGQGGCGAPAIVSARERKRSPCQMLRCPSSARTLYRLEALINFSVPAKARSTPMPSPFLSCARGTGSMPTAGHGAGPPEMHSWRSCHLLVNTCPACNLAPLTGSVPASLISTQGHSLAASASLRIK